MWPSSDIAAWPCWVMGSSRRRTSPQRRRTDTHRGNAGRHASARPRACGYDPLRGIVSECFEHPPHTVRPRVCVRPRMVCGCVRVCVCVWATASARLALYSARQVVTRTSRHTLTAKRWPCIPYVPARDYFEPAMLSPPVLKKQRY